MGVVAPLIHDSKVSLEKLSEKNLDRLWEIECGQKTTTTTVEAGTTKNDKTINNSTETKHVGSGGKKKDPSPVLHINTESKKTPSPKLDPIDQSSSKSSAKGSFSNPNRIPLGGGSTTTNKAAGQQQPSGTSSTLHTTSRSEAAATKVLEREKAEKEKEREAALRERKRKEE